MASQFTLPKPFLESLVGSTVGVKIKWGMEYKGDLVSFDNYMNLLLTNAEEFVDGEITGSIGDVLIRCNNVQYVRSLEGGQ